MHENKLVPIDPETYGIRAGAHPYITLLLAIWLPLFLLSEILTEIGTYGFVTLSVFYIARCMLRLSAFPGTNVKVYGEIELEFARYSWKLLEGVCGAVEGFGRAVGSDAGACDGNNNGGTKAKRVLGEEAWDTDLPTTYKRVVVYRDRVLGVYWQVLHCLLKEGGRGCDPYHERAEPSNFYGRDALKACKCNLCCGNVADATVGGDDASVASEPGNSLPTVNKYGNDPLQRYRKHDQSDARSAIRRERTLRPSDADIGRFVEHDGFLFQYYKRSARPNGEGRLFRPRRWLTPD